MKLTRIAITALAVSAVTAPSAFARTATDPQPVVITNTADAPVPVAGTVNVGNSQPIPVTVTNQPAAPSTGTPVVATAEVPIPSGETSGSAVLLTPPNGKRFEMSFAYISTLLPNEQTPFINLRLGYKGVQSFPQFTPTAVPRANGVDTGWFQTIPLQGVSDAPVVAFFNLEGGTALNRTARVTVIGRYVDDV